MRPGYADEDVKAAIVAGLRQRGMDVVTAQERGQRRTDDEVLLATATAEECFLLTNDTDFLRIHAEWMAGGRSHAGIVYWPRIGRSATSSVASSNTRSRPTRPMWPMP